MAVRFVELDAGGFARYADESIEVYLAAMDRPAELAPQRRGMLARHLTYDGLHAVVALDDAGRLAGFGYSYPGRTGQWWHDSVYSALRHAYGRGTAVAWLSDSREVVELHVRPPEQGQGIGRRLLATLIERTKERTVLLSTNDRESPARALYRSVGFVDLLAGYRFPGGTDRYAVMGLELAARAG